MDELKALLAAVLASDNDAVDAALAHFAKLKRVATLDGATGVLLDARRWPKSAGVYLIWHSTAARDARTLLYIGKTGTLRRRAGGQCEMGGGLLRARLGRWTPYKFGGNGADESAFLYGPTFKETRRPPADTRTSYSHRLPLTEIVVDCVMLNDIESSVSPALLEALLLQVYLVNYGTLPPANREL